MLKKSLWILTAVLIGCAKPTSDQPKPPHQSVISLPNLQGKRVIDLFVVLFPKDYTVKEWQTIFEDTQSLSRNRRWLRENEGKFDDSTNELRAKISGENGVILTRLTSQSLTILNWTSTQNCKFNTSGLMKCRPFDGSTMDQYPSQAQTIEWIRPDPVKDSVRIPYLSFNLQKESAVGEHYSIELRLKVERKSDTEIWLKGDTAVSPHSIFMNINSNALVSQFYPFGYSEMTLSP